MRVEDTLSGLERKVLRLLKGEMSDEELLEKGIKDIELNRALSWLESKGLVRVRREVKEVVRLTELGKRYVEEGLPEKRFLSVLAQKGELDFKSVMRYALLDAREFSAAMGRLKEKGMIEVKKNRVRITEKGEKYLGKESVEEKFLKELEEGPKRMRKGMEELLRRGIIAKEVAVKRYVRLTRLGRRVAKRLKEEVIEQITPEVIRKGLWKGKKIRAYDIRAKVPKRPFGKPQPYLAFLNEVREKLIALGFKEMQGPLVELSFWNCDALFMPQDHPARGIHDIYYVKRPKYGKVDEELLEKVAKAHEKGVDGSKGWGYKFSKKESKRLILRSQNTALSARTLAGDVEIPGKYFAIARVFRPDVVDRTHLPEFNQVEGIVLGEGLSFKHLLGMLKLFAEEIAGTKRFRFDTGYFPFTEPSVELVGYKKGFGWVELGGAGIFRPEVTKPFGIDVPVLAWGLGIDRLFMMKYKIDDIRKLFSYDLEWLRCQP